MEDRHKIFDIIKDFHEKISKQQFKNESTIENYGWKFYTGLIICIKIENRLNI